MSNYIHYKNSPIKHTGHIKLFDNEAFEKMRQVGRLAALCLDELVDIVKPGIKTSQIDEFVMQFALKHNIIPATLNYRGYPYACCTSINHVVCHGMPGNRVLKNGDIINIDVTFILDGWHGDSSRMYPVGKIKQAAKNLLLTTYESLMLAIEQVKPGATIGDIGAAIQKHAHSRRYSVVEDFCGHGIGQLFHDEPNILHFGEAGEGIELKEGMIFTIEPMINIGKKDVKILPDGWTSVTKDKSLTAQYEHTLAVTTDGYEIFTLSPNDCFYIESN